MAPQIALVAHLDADWRAVLARVAEFDQRGQPSRLGPSSPRFALWWSDGPKPHAVGLAKSACGTQA
jgi:hypothetical protein